MPAPAGRHRGRAARHRLHPADGQRPGEERRPAGRARRRRGDGGARARGHPGPHRGDAGRGRGRRRPSSRWGAAGSSGSGRARCAPGPGRCPATRPRPPSGWWPGSVVPGSRVTVEQLHLGPERHRVPRRPGPDGGRRRRCTTSGATSGSVTGTSCGPWLGTVVEAAEIPSLDEVPILAVAALVADGTDPLLRRGGAAGEGVGPAGRAPPSWSGPSAARPGWRVTTWWSRAGPARPAGRRWTPGATTAWPWPPRWPPPALPGGRPAVDRHRLGGGGHQLPRLRRRTSTGWPAATR